MQKAGKIQQAFSALKELTDISPESAHLRGMLEEHLRMYGSPERRSTGAAPAPAAPKAEPKKEDLTKSGRHKSQSLVFLDLDEPPASKAKPDARAAPPPRVAAPPRREPEPVTDSLIE